LGIEGSGSSRIGGSDFSCVLINLPESKYVRHIIASFIPSHAYKTSLFIEHKVG
jgi:hypothetical protein